MEGPEVPLEAVQEHIHEHAHGHHGGGQKERWILGVALTSAIVAALAAVSALKAGHHANEALISQIDANNQILKASDQWALYQAKGVKGSIVRSRINTFEAFAKEVPESDRKNADRYDHEQEEIKKEAQEHEHKADELRSEGKEHLEIHLGLAKSVTMFQICIAIAAVSVLTNRRLFWFVSLAFAAYGVYAMVVGLSQ